MVRALGLRGPSGTYAGLAVAAPATAAAWASATLPDAATVATFLQRSSNARNC